MKNLTFILLSSILCLQASAASQRTVMSTYNSYNTGDRDADAKLVDAQLESR
jgi:hypothetical protein